MFSLDDPSNLVKIPLPQNMTVKSIDRPQSFTLTHDQPSSAIKETGKFLQWLF
jgi:hypothetical protein